MPNRILKHTICTSRNINALSMEAETLFYRLMVNCDDYGRFYADPAIVRGYCMPMRQGVTDEAVSKWIAELVAADLVWLYAHDGASYMQITKWLDHQKPRAGSSKFPEPQTSASNCAQVQTSASNCAQMLPYSYSYSYSYSDSDSISEKPAADAAPEPAPAIAPEPEKPKRARKATTVPEELLLTSITHGAELQAALTAHFSGLARPVPAWIAFASKTQRDAFQATANALDGEFVKLATAGLARGVSQREKLLGWLEGCVRKKRSAPQAQARADPRNMSVADKLALIDSWAADDAANGVN